MDLIRHIQEDFPLSESESRLLVITAAYRYKVHSIEKRNGRGKRLIAQPTAEVKMLQRWAYRNFASTLPVHDAATAYRPGKSIKTHAALHAANAYLLKLDFQDFFPSIRGEDFLMHLERFANIPAEDAKYLTRLFFWKSPKSKGLTLSIGAPSSPDISNTILYLFDEELSNFCVSIGAVYSRYADDLAISTNTPRALDKVYKFVQELCKRTSYPTLSLNKDKTVFTSKKRQRQLTGLVLANSGTPSLGREKKRLLRAMAHYYKRGLLDENKTNRLRGLLAFSISIEPAFVESIRKMLSHDVFDCLMKGGMR